MDKNISFEESMTALEKLVSELESGELTLDQSISDFEKAVSLIGICQSKLDEAEQRVRAITTAADGTLTDVPFSTDFDED
jgi:exodeoxyribonuclease VII small subunit